MKLKKILKRPAKQPSAFCFSVPPEESGRSEAGGYSMLDTMRAGSLPLPFFVRSSSPKDLKIDCRDKMETKLQSSLI